MFFALSLSFSEGLWFVIGMSRGRCAFESRVADSGLRLAPNANLRAVSFHLDKTSYSLGASGGRGGV